MGKNKIMFGLEKVHLAFKEDGEYTTPVHIPGAVDLALSAEGDTETFHADNISYFIATSNNGYTGDLEMALVPDEILAKMLGWEIDKNGMLVEIVDGIQKEFALLFEVKGNVKNKRYIYYNCQASRPDKNHKTKTETIEPDTSTLALTITPAEIEDKLITKGGLELSDENKLIYDGFFKTVLKPSFSEEVA